MVESHRFYYHRGYDYWILKLDALGNSQWQSLIGGSADDTANSIIQLDNGNFIVVGYSSSSNTGTLSGLTTNGASDIWIIKLDQYGHPIS